MRGLERYCSTVGYCRTGLPTLHAIMPAMPWSEARFAPHARRGRWVSIQVPSERVAMWLVWDVTWCDVTMIYIYIWHDNIYNKTTKWCFGRMRLCQSQRDTEAVSLSMSRLEQLLEATSVRYILLSVTSCHQLLSFPSPMFIIIIIIIKHLFWVYQCDSLRSMRFCEPAAILGMRLHEGMHIYTVQYRLWIRRWRCKHWACQSWRQRLPH